VFFLKFVSISSSVAKKFSIEENIRQTATISSYNTGNGKKNQRKTCFFLKSKNVSNCNGDLRL